MGIPSKQTGPADGRAAFRRPFHGGAGRAPAEALRRSMRQLDEVGSGDREMKGALSLSDLK